MTPGHSGLHIGPSLRWTIFGRELGSWGLDEYLDEKPIGWYRA